MSKVRTACQQCNHLIICFRYHPNSIVSAFHYNDIIACNNAHTIHIIESSINGITIYIASRSSLSCQYWHAFYLGILKVVRTRYRLTHRVNAHSYLVETILLLRTNAIQRGAIWTHHGCLSIAIEDYFYLRWVGAEVRTINYKLCKIPTRIREYLRNYNGKTPIKGFTLNLWCLITIIIRTGN